MNALLSKKLIIKGHVCSFFISLMFFVIAISFVAFYQQSKSNNYLNEVKDKLILIFNENEDIADAITTKYSSLISKNTCITPVISENKNNMTWFFNPVKDKGNNKFNGVFITSKQPDKITKCLLSASIYIHNQLLNSDLETKDGFRYIISVKKEMFYFFNKIDVSSFDVEHSLLLENVSEYVPISSHYYKRKLTKNLTQKGTVATPLYTDIISGQNSYSVVSFIYNMNESTDPIAYLLYDHTHDEIQQLARTTLPKINWMNITLHETHSNKEMCVFGCDTHRGFYNDSTTERLSNAFTLHARTDIVGSIIQSEFFKYILLCTIILYVFSLRAAINYLIKSRKYAMIDHLTGLYSRKVEQEIDQDALSGTYVAMIDCNKFKEINDLYGHNAGDQILLSVAHIIKACIRKNDIGIRYGGDEFLLLLYTDKLDEAEKVMDRIVTRVAETSEYVDGKLIPFSISFGIAPFISSLKESINQADMAMYRMKRGSDYRNGV